MNDLKNALRPLNSAMMVGHALLGIFWLWKNNQCKNNGQFS